MQRRKLRSERKKLLAYKIETLRSRSRRHIRRRTRLNRALANYVVYKDTKPAINGPTKSLAQPAAHQRDEQDAA
jgi:hypothetical protein